MYGRLDTFEYFTDYPALILVISSVLRQLSKPFYAATEQAARIQKGQKISRSL